MIADDMPDCMALAAIRPGDPKEKLAAAVGCRWRDPRPEEAGRVTYLQENFHFTARLDRDDRVGEVNFGISFPEHAIIEGAHLLMPEAEVTDAVPHMKLSEPTQNFPYRIGHLDLPGGARLGIEVGSGRIRRIWISNPQAVYSGIGVLPLPRPMSTFDVEVVPGLHPRGTPAPDGWCCGLPRGINPIQWPLSHKSGFPLEHHFTVRVPEPYRVKGPAYIALAVFSESSYDSKRARAIHNLMDIIFDGRPLPDVTAPELQPFLDHLHNHHPMEFRSKDILHQTFAMIWLTEEEFGAAECEPPVSVVTAANDHCELPHWLSASAAQRMFGWSGDQEFDQDYYLHRLAGRKPSGPWDLLLLKQRERQDDPNTGRQPVDSLAIESEDGYVPKFTEDWDALGIDITYGDLHFGGTANPCQEMPNLSPFYIEIEQTMGMANFGGGNGQIDLISMQIDWACP